MPRRHPAARRPRKRGPIFRYPVMRGFSPRLLADVDQLELTRNYLYPSYVGVLLQRWTRFMHKSPYLRFRDTDIGPEFPPPVCDCCFDPYEARVLLEFVTLALPRKSAKELRKRLDELDDVY
ncbi:hypothetical protein [Lentzea atacamensis]|nr:hypothetical protein [Lentzea atacamensis]